MHLTLIYFLIIFSVLVFVHEFGHFIVAKKQGITVHEFGFGFPPRIFSRMWRGTLYSINALPLGGFVRIKGEEGEDAQDNDSFSHRPFWQRALIIVAGVAMNVVLGWVLFTGGFIIGSPTFIDASIPKEYIRDARVLVRAVLPHAPATETDLRVGDTLTAIDGTPVATIEDVHALFDGHEGKEAVLTVQRNRATQEIRVTPRIIPEARRVGIGVALDAIGTVRYPFFVALWEGARITGRLLWEVLIGFWGLVRDLVVQQRLTVDLSGPIGIAVLTGRIAREGILQLLQFTAILSLNLAVLNILPIPALDGGRLLFLVIEKLRGKSLARVTEGVIHRIGFILLLLLVVLVTYKDITRLFL